MPPALVKTTREKRRPRVRGKPYEGLEARAGTEMPSLMGGQPAPLSRLLSGNGRVARSKERESLHTAVLLQTPSPLDMKPEEKARAMPD